MRKRPLEERFWEKVAIVPFYECWEWMAYVQPCGYGLFRPNPNANMELAHRISYEMVNGKIKENFVIDHICRNRKCVNPKHLRQVTRSQNSLENSISPSAINKEKTHCNNGHEFSIKNTRVTALGGRICRACRNKYEVIWKRAKRARNKDCLTAKTKAI